MKAIKIILLLFIITITSVQSQNKINLKGFVLEVLDVDYIKISGPKIKEYFKLELWEENVFKAFIKTKDKKYRYNFKQEGFCSFNSGLNLKTSVNPGRQILIITLKKNGKLERYSKIINTLN